jgi:excisionase family DNA binding protein
MTLAEQTLQEYEKAEPALLLSAKQTAKALGVSRTTLYALNSSGHLPQSVKLGGRTLWRAAELMAWVSCEPPCPSRERWEQIRGKNCEK